MLLQLMIIFIVNYIGIIISKGLNLPVPGTITGLILFFLLLYNKIIKVEQVENGVNALLLNMTILFLPPIIRILDSTHLLEGKILKLFILVVATTLITMGITGKIVQIMIEFSEKREKVK